MGVMKPQSAPATETSELNTQEETFCREYLIDCSATRAAIRAGYSKASAHSQGCRMLQRKPIRDYIAKLVKEKSTKQGLSVDLVLSRLLEIGTVDIAEAFDKKGRLKNIHDIPEEVRRAISGVDVEQLYEGSGKDRFESGVVVKLKFWDKNKALENLGRYLKLFVDKVEIKDGSGLAEKLAKARGRVGR